MKALSAKTFNWEKFWSRATTTKAAKALNARDGEGAAKAAIAHALATEANMTEVQKPTEVDSILDSLPDFWSFWELASPEQAATALRQMYAEKAATAAQKSADHARRDGRDGDYRFWTAVLGRLSAPRRS